MAVTDPYATHTEYQSIIGKSSSADNTNIDNQCTLMSRVLERRLNRFFNKDTSAVARYYYPKTPSGGFGDVDSENPWIGSGLSRRLEVDDIASISGLAITIDTDQDGDFTDETALGATDYELAPLNAGVGPEPAPWTEIRLPRWSTYSCWPAGCKIKVSAIWGYPAVPKAIVEGTVRLVSMFRAEGIFATGQIPEMDEAVAQSADARKLLDELSQTYKRRWYLR